MDGISTMNLNDMGGDSMTPLFQTQPAQSAPPTTAPPKVKPTVKPGPRTRPAHPGKNPNPNENPAPKAKKDKLEVAKAEILKAIQDILNDGKID